MKRIDGFQKLITFPFFFTFTFIYFQLYFVFTSIVFDDTYIYVLQNMFSARLNRMNAIQKLITLPSLFYSLRIQTRASYQYLRKVFRLTMDEISEQKPTDIAYVHSGYAPLSVRLIHNLARGDWKAVEDAIATLPGPLINDVQQLPPGMRRRRSKPQFLSFL